MEFPQVTCDDVNALVEMCSIPHETAITSLKQCSSSLFVLLYQRLFNCTIMGIDSSPFTAEKKKWNVKCVLNELQNKRGMNVDGIDAEKIVQLDEEHISRLIALFLVIAKRMMPHGNAARGGGGLPVGSGLAAPPPFSVAPMRPKLAEVPHDLAEDGTWYPPTSTLHALPTHVVRPVYPGHGGVTAAVQAYVHHNGPFYRGHYDPAQLEDTMDNAPDRHEGHADSLRSGGNIYPDGAETDMSASEVVNSGDDGKASSMYYGESEESFDYMGREIPTSQLVEVWKAQVIPPKLRVVAGDSLDLAGLRGQLTAMDKCLRRKQRERDYLHCYRDQQPVDPQQRRPVGAAAGGFSTAAGRTVSSFALPQRLHVDAIKEEKLYRKQMRRMIDYERRDEKIEMLRSVRFIDDLEREIGRKMAQRHRDTTMRLREEVRAALERDRQEVMERRKLIREEDEKYRKAYSAILTAASNNLRTTKGLMLERMQRLAQQQAVSLRESRRMCRVLKRESKERVRHDLLRYASAVTEWQSHFGV